MMDRKAIEQICADRGNFEGEGGSSMKIYLVSYTAKQRIRSSKIYTGDVIIETSGDMLTKDGIEQIREQMMEDMKFTKLAFINIIELKG